MYKYIIGLMAVLQLLSSCGNTESINNTLIYVMVDKTEDKLGIENIAKESVNEILQLGGFSEDGSSPNGCKVKMFDINSLSNNRSRQVEIEPGSVGWNGDNSLDRNDAIQRFKSDLSNLLDVANENSKTGFDQSKIYQNICRELNAMAGEGVSYNSKRFIIFSDMLENSDLYSFYTSAVDFTEETELQKVLELLEKSNCIIPDLSEIEVHIVVSRDEQNDEMINKSELLWKYIFEVKNAKRIEFDSELGL